MSPRISSIGSLSSSSCSPMTLFIPNKWSKCRIWSNIVISSWPVNTNPKHTVMRGRESADRRSPFLALPALEPVVYDLFLVRSKTDNKELEAQRMVIVQTLLKLVRYNKVTECRASVRNHGWSHSRVCNCWLWLSIVCAMKQTSGSVSLDKLWTFSSGICNRMSPRLAWRWLVSLILDRPWSLSRLESTSVGYLFDTVGFVRCRFRRRSPSDRSIRRGLSHSGQPKRKFLLQTTPNPCFLEAKGLWSSDDQALVHAREYHSSLSDSKLQRRRAHHTLERCSVDDIGDARWKLQRVSVSSMIAMMSFTLIPIQVLCFAFCTMSCSDFWPTLVNPVVKWTRRWWRWPLTISIYWCISWKMVSWSPSWNESASLVCSSETIPKHRSRVASNPHSWWRWWDGSSTGFLFLLDCAEWLLQIALLILHSTATPMDTSTECSWLHPRGLVVIDALHPHSFVANHASIPDRSIAILLRSDLSAWTLRWTSHIDHHSSTLADAPSRTEWHVYLRS